MLCISLFLISLFHYLIYLCCEGKNKARGKTKIRSREKKVKVGDDANHDLKLASECLKQANEDILFEIFLRLPNCRSVILFGSVCHRWQSLISQPQFIPRFICHHHEHQDRYSLPYTIIFRKADIKVFKGFQYYQPICKVISEESMFLHGKAARSSTSTYLDFLPSPKIIRASCNDLLLVSPGPLSSRDHYICNPITKQFYELPKLHFNIGTAIGYALLCSNEQVGFSTVANFKVVKFHFPRHPAPESGELATNAVSIFCSKSGKWTRYGFQYPGPKSRRLIRYVDFVTCDGILYWLEYDDFAVDRVIALDLWNGGSVGVGVAIDFPGDYWCGWQDSLGRVRLGGVGGELRLYQIVVTGVEWIVNLKVWKLDDDTSSGSSWVLVHDKKYLERPNNEKQLVDLFVHPTNADVVFIVWGNNVFQYKIMEDAYEMVGELQDGFIYKVDRLLAFSMVHPTWPTPVPSI